MNETIEERAYKYACRTETSASFFCDRENGYKVGAKEQREIEIDKACNIFCHTGCPHKTDSYNCINDKCDTWKIFRRMMKEEI